MRDLEQFADRALRALTPLTAPDTLLPRVMAAVRQWSERPWYRRAWFTWPIRGQVAAFAALSAAGVGGIAILGAMHRATLGGVVAVLSGGTSDAAALIRSIVVVTASIDGIYQTWIGPLALFAAGVVIILVAGSAVLGMALNHVLWERA